jgi:hypothetical protein
LGDAAKGAWDAMLDIGREKSIEQKMAEAQDELGRAQKSLSDLSAGQSKYAGPYGAWKSSDLSMLQRGRCCQSTTSFIAVRENGSGHN